MRITTLIRFSFMQFMFLCAAVSFADNPIVQTYYTADPAPMVYNDRVYLFTSHDEDVTESNFFTMRNWRCYSSADMVNWTDHGSPGSLSSFSWVTVNNGAWAPQCVERDGKFYLYVPIQGKGIGVLVSNSPTGPYTDPIGKALVNKNGYNDIDPTAYVDSTGQAYLYWGNPYLYYVKLNTNMTSYTGDVVTVSQTEASFGKRSTTDTDHTTTYEEGPWFYKRNSLYYMVFAGGPVSEHIGYSTSTGPTGPWTYKGKVMPTQGGSFTNHPGVCDFKGNSYLFYHNAALSGGGGYKRSVCVEQFKYGTDGSIPTTNMTTNGPAQVGTLNPYDTIQAETICWSTGIKTESCTDGGGGQNVTSISNGDYIKVKGVNFGTSGATTFDARVASTSSGNIELRLGSLTGTLIGTCAVSNTGGAQTYATKTCTVSGATGTQDLYLKFTGGSGDLFKFNWWKFSGPAVNTIEPVSEKVINVAKVSFKKQSVQFDFSNQIIQNNLSICLFDLNGRMTATLFSGKLSQSRLEIPLEENELHRGMYILKVSTENKTILEQQVVVKN
jgi:arabinoxylan arabinofuranohydrolase